MKDDRLYVIHIRECIERIESYITEKDLPALKKAIQKMLDAR